MRKIFVGALGGLMIAIVLTLMFWFGFYKSSLSSDSVSALNVKKNIDAVQADWFSSNRWGVFDLYRRMYPKRYAWYPSRLISEYREVDGEKKLVYKFYALVTEWDASVNRLIVSSYLGKDFEIILEKNTDIVQTGYALGAALVNENYIMVTDGSRTKDNSSLFCAGADILSIEIDNPNEMNNKEITPNLIQLIFRSGCHTQAEPI